MESVVNESVKVGAVFERNSIKLRWFLWRNRRLDVKEVNYVWKAREGETMITYFSVSDGGASYLLSFNHRTLEWKLEKVYAE